MSILDVSYDDKAYGNLIDPYEWNQNFLKIEQIFNQNKQIIEDNFNSVSSSNTPSEAIEGLGQALPSTVREQLLLIVNLLSTKANSDEVNSSISGLLKSAVLEESTGVVTFTKYDGSTFTIDFATEKIPAKFELVDSGENVYLKITNIDGSFTQTDVTSLLNIYLFNNSSNVEFTVDGYNVTAKIKSGSIVKSDFSSDLISYFDDNVAATAANALSAETSKLAAESAKNESISARDSALNSENNAKTYRDSANANYLLSKSYAVGSTGVRSNEDTDNAEYYMNQAKSHKDSAVAAKDIAVAASEGAKSSESKAEEYKNSTSLMKGEVVSILSEIQAARDVAVEAKTSAETARDDSVSAKDESVSAKEYSVAAKEAAEAAKNSAEQAKEDAVVAKTAAETAQSASETAQTAAEKAASDASSSAASALSAKDAASVSEANAKDSADTAASAKTAAKTSETNAKESETNAKSSEEIAVAAKTDAVSAKIAAETAKLGAESAKTDLETARDEAIAAKDESVSAREFAVAAKEAADTAKTSAETSASNAASSAASALEYKESSAISEVNAANSASAAVTAKEAAETAKTEAETAKNESISAKEGAIAAKTAAETARDQAQEIVGGDYATKTELAQGLSTKLSASDIINNLTSGGTSVPLSAEQGKVLKGLIDKLNGDSSEVGSVAYQIAEVVAGADARYDTLKEIADWIISDTTGAAKMASDILALQNEMTSHTANNDMHVTADEKAAWNEKANKSTISSSTMSASGWGGSVYSFESTYPHATYDIEIALDSTATSEQAEAFNGAQIVGSATSNVVKAYGIVPTVDIPICIKAVMK